MKDDWNAEAYSRDDLEFAEVERMLGALPLRQPPAKLDERIRHMTRPVSRLEKVRWIGVGAAAMLALTLGAAPFLPRRHPAPSALPPSIQPDRPIPLLQDRGNSQSREERPLLVRHTTSQVANDGIVGFVGDTPVQRQRKKSVQQMWLIDPTTGARIAVTVPREEVIVRRVQTF